MNKSSILLTAEQKVGLAAEFTQKMFDDYHVIEAIIIFGSYVRGDQLPVSDIDLGYFLPEEADDPRIPKQLYQEVFMDIHPYRTNELDV